MTSTDQLIERFIATLESLDGSAGNQRLLEALGWQEATYQRVKQQLIDDGRLIPGRGRGGSVTLAPQRVSAAKRTTPSPRRADDTPKAPPAAAVPKGSDTPAPKPPRPTPAASTPPPAPMSSPELDYADKLWKAADKLRGNMEPSDYKHVALGLIFLKYISDAFENRHAELLAEDAQAAEDKDEYLADTIFWVPKEARWSYLKANAKRPEIGVLIDAAMQAIEKDNDSLKSVLPKDYGRPALNKIMLGELIDLVSDIALGENSSRAKDVLGRVYEYFLGQFAGSEGKRGGEFYTPRSVVRVLVEMLEPYQGRVYDPCCGSGGMFVQSEKFVREHGGRLGDIAIYGQESNYTTTPATWPRWVFRSWDNYG